MKRTDHIDAEISRMLKQNLPQAPETPWFTRKVMNRLPDKPLRRSKSVAEIVCYVIAAVGLMGAWCYSIHTTLSDGLSMYTATLSGLLTLLTLFCIGVFAFPMLRKAV